MDTCPECGFTYGLMARRDLAPTIGETGCQISAALTGPVEVLTARRTPEEWSPLEYGCHLRDVLLVQRDRLYVALVEDGPSFKPMYRDQRVVFDRYSDQAVEVVQAQLLMVAAMAAHAFNGLSDEQWVRPLIYNFPEPSDRDVEWMAHHTIHELVHHHADIVRILSA